MINLPNYDDQVFEDIVKKAINKIKTIYPEWTDYNEHDPGITILELFAWLKEMQQYHLNELTSEGYESILKLLHTKLLKEVPARLEVAVDTKAQGITLKPYTPFYAGEIPYENQESAELGKYKLRNVYFKEEDGYICANEILDQEGMYIVLNKQSNPNEASLYLEIECDLKRLSNKLSLYWEIEDDYPIKRIKNVTNENPPRDIIWEYSSVNGSFKEAKVIRDDTYALSFSGFLGLNIGKDVASHLVNGEERLLIRARILRNGCEEQPKIAHIYENVIELTQERTYTIGTSTEATYKAGKASVKVVDDFSNEVEHLLFIKDEYGYYIQNEYEEKEWMDKGVSYKEIHFSPIKTNLSKESSEVYAISYAEAFRRNMILGSSNGLPYQSFKLDINESVIPEKMCIMVEETVEDDIKRWGKWYYVDKLSQLGPYDKCFTYDAANHEVVFGDNEMGAVPEAGENNLIITELTTTQGKAGNIGKQTLSPIHYLDSEITPVKIMKMFSGEDAETIQDAIGRLKIDLKRTVKAVTAQDYENIVRNMPGIRLLGIKVIPGYNSEEILTNRFNDPTTVTVVVVPYNLEEQPMPDEVFLNKIKRYLEEYRILTTRIKVIAPCYVGMKVYIEAELQDIGIRSTQYEIKESILHHFDFKDKMEKKEEIIGVSVNEEKIIQDICKLPNVIRVKQMEISCEERLCYRNKQGKVTILKHAIPYLQDIELVVSEI